MPYWFSASRAPGGNKSSPVQTTRTYTHTHTRGPVLIFDPPTYLFARALFSETRERVYGVSTIIISERNRCTVCVCAIYLGNDNDCGLKRKLIVFFINHRRVARESKGLFNFREKWSLLLSLKKYFEAIEKSSSNHLEKIFRERKEINK